MKNGDGPLKSIAVFTSSKKKSYFTGNS
jgi:hypothetical protein